MRWLAEQLAAQRNYTEPQLNAELKKYHSDVAALRRHLTEFKLMVRDAQNIFRHTTRRPQ